MTDHELLELAAKAAGIERGQEMNKVMYEVNWHHANGKFSHCSVTPITVFREGVLAGCTGVTISAKDSSGRKFIGTPDNYYASEAEAWEAITAELAQCIASREKASADMASELATMREFFEKLRSDEVSESRTQGPR